MSRLVNVDPKVAGLIRQEEERIENTLDLIAAENHMPRAVNEALGSILNTKTIEGYPGRRFHAGCRLVDQVENLAVERAERLFGAGHANVQPLSGTTANMAVYFSVLDIGDRILAMNLAHGGHLSHGHKASITSRCFSFSHYGVDPETELIDYDQIRDLALSFRPKLIVAGASSYPRLIDYELIADIAREISAYLLVDMAHIAGLVAARVIPSPVPHSDFVTFTTYKTMMGGRGGVILCRREHAAQVDRTVFPGCQGTSPVNFIAAKAIIFEAAENQWFKQLQRQTLINADRLAKELMTKGFRPVSGGTDNHQVLLDLTSSGITGGQAEQLLESVGLIANRNSIPRDAGKPGAVSGLRLGSAAVTARGMGEEEMALTAGLIAEALKHQDDPDYLNRIQQEVLSLCRRFPVYNGGGPSGA